MTSRLAIIAAVICLSACAEPRPNDDKTYEEIKPPGLVKLSSRVRNGTYKFCDMGRAVYIVYGSTDSIAVVDNAQECEE